MGGSHGTDVMLQDGDGGELVAFDDATELLDDHEALRQRFAEDGYLLLRGVIDRDVVGAAARDIVDVCARHGWFVAGTDPFDAVPRVEPRVEGEKLFFDVYDDIQRLESFHAVPHHESVRRCVTPLLGEDAFPHPLSIARLVFPDNDEWATPPHQDYPNNQGTPDLFTVWTPLHDCTVAHGSLSVLRGSHRFGLLPLQASLGAGHRKVRLDDRFAGLDWVGGDLRVGDALVFHSHTVHRSLPNRSNRLRLSVDYRFQREGDALTEGCLAPHFGRLTWDEIYEGWTRDDLRYYWENRRYVVEPWDPAIHAIPEEEFEASVLEWFEWRRRHPSVDIGPIPEEVWQALNEAGPPEVGSIIRRDEAGSAGDRG